MPDIMGYFYWLCKNVISTQKIYVYYNSDCVCVHLFGKGKKGGVEKTGWVVHVCIPSCAVHGW